MGPAARDAVKNDPPKPAPFDSLLYGRVALTLPQRATDVNHCRLVAVVKPSLEYAVRRTRRRGNARPARRLQYLSYVRSLQNVRTPEPDSAVCDGYAPIS